MVDPVQVVWDLAWYMGLAGAVLNFVGGMMMASGYLSIARPGLFWWRSLLILAEVWLPRRGRTAATGATFNAADNHRILRGIGLVVLGFALQFASVFAQFPR